MTTWCGHDGSFHDDEGDGPADLSGLDEEIAVGWQDPFTDWRGNLFEGMGQYGVYTVTDPWEPAEIADQPYPFPDDPPYVWPAGEPVPPYEPPPPPPETHAQQPESPGSTPSQPGTPTIPHFGPPSRTTRRRAPSGGAGSSRSTVARGATMTGFDVPFTDDGGHLLMDPHPSHQDWPWPMTYGGPVMTGWETPFTDLEGSLLRGAGQYGTFTMTNPYDHSNFSNVDLDSEKLIGDPFYRYTGSAADENLGLYLHGMTATGADADAGQQFGSALGTAFGAATGDDAKAWGQAGSSIASSIEQGSDSGDWGGAIASIASAAAKVAVPAIVKAASSGSKPSTTATPSAGTPTTPSVTPPAATAQHQAALARDPRRQAMQKLMVQMRKLAQQYGISIPPPRRAVAQPSGATLQQLQQFMQSVAPQQGAS